MLSTHPIAAGAIPVASRSLNLPSFIVQNLKDKGIEHLFPAQSEVVPFLMCEGYNHDVCVMSPTGSGKTLAYAIPIVKRLYRRVIPRIRSIVIVPSQDLAMQVKCVFDDLVKNTTLKVCTISNRKLKEEQLIINDADIIITTPVHLQSHIDLNEDFTLQHLEFMVLDEADKLLSSFSPWFTTIFLAIYNTHQGIANVPLTGNMASTQLTICTTRMSHVHPKAFENSPPLRRWLFSATLTIQSALLAPLHLHDTVFFSSVSSSHLTTATVKYQFPKSLQQYFICVPGNERGMALVKLIDDITNTFANAKIACFAQSFAACHRLSTTLKLMRPNVSILEFFAELEDAERASVLSKFKKGHANIVVCSDLMARGLDITGINAIINYDLPDHIKAYVHRVGRTARGGEAGVAYTIIDPTEQEAFLQMIQKGDSLQLKEIVYNEAAYTDDLKNQFKAVVSKLHDVLEKESRSVKRLK